MYWTRQDDSFRGWFQVVRTNGTLRTGLGLADFTVNVVNQEDSLSIVPFVSESVQKSGLYYFEIPTTFFVAGGLGEYGISVEINTTTPPNVVAAFSDVIRISENDLDSLTSSLVDPITSGVWGASSFTFNTSGTMGGFIQTLLTQISGTVNIISSSTTPAQLADAVWTAVTSSFNSPGTMGFLQNLLTNISSSLNVSALQSAVWSASDVNFNVSGTMGFLQNLIDDISGNIGNLNVNVDTAQIVSGVWNASSATFNNPGTMGFVLNLVSSISGAVTPASLASSVWNAASSSFNAPDTMGFLQNLIDNISSSIGTGVTITSSSVDNITNAVWDVSAASHNFSGTTGYLLNQAAGTSTTVTASVDIPLIVSGVWDAQRSTFTTAGSFGEALGQVYDIEVGTWMITGSQIVFFRSGTLDAIARFNLQDINGIAIDPSTQNPFRRVRV